MEKERENKREEKEGRTMLVLEEREMKEGRERHEGKEGRKKRKGTKIV